MPTIPVGKAVSVGATATLGSRFIKGEDMKASFGDGAISGGAVIAESLLASNVSAISSLANSISGEYGNDILAAVLATLVKQYMSKGIADQSTLRRFIYELGYVLGGATLQTQFEKVLPGSLTGNYTF